MEKFKQIIKASVKNVWFNKKQYVFFAVFLLFVQSLLSCVILFNHNNNQNELRFLEEKYRISVGGNEEVYHVVVSNLTEDQVSEVVYYYNSLQEVKRYFRPVATERVVSGGSTRCNLYLYFFAPQGSDQTPYECYEDFLRTAVYRESLSENAALYETPYLLATRSAALNNTATAVICLLITALGVLVFCLLFNTVVNHFKFSYGIYMTFGANFRKLFSNALCEMLVVNFVTFIPAFLLSLFITWILTLRAGYGIDVLVYPMFLSLLCSIVLTTISVALVMKRLSRQTPNNLIRSVNNESLITSPRRSTPIPQGGFPIKTELLSLKRFRKYVVTLVLSTLIFAGAFCGGVFVMNAQSTKENMVRPQFALSFPTGGILHDTTPADTSASTPDSESGSPDTTAPETAPESTEDLPLEYPEGTTYTSEVREILYQIEGVDRILKERSFAASLLISHILVPSNRLTLSGKLSSVGAGDGYRGFGNVDYCLIDEEVIDNLIYMGYTITGDLNAVLTDDHTIAISDSFNNTVKTKLKVGDTIRIAVDHHQYRRLPSDLPVTAKELLSVYLDCYNFEYEEFTVGAIISDMPVGASLPVYLAADDFEALTGTTAYFADVEILCDPDADEETIRNIQTRLYTLQQAWKMSVTNTSQDTLKETAYLKNYPGIILYVSCLVLFISVLIMVLSQALFYQMRKQEFDIYLCLGANFKKIRRLHLFDAVFFTGLSAICYTVFALFFNYLFYRIANTNLGDAETRFAFNVPLWAYLTGLGVTLLASFFSVMSTYLGFRKKAAPVFTGKKVDAVEERSGESAIFDADAK